MANYCSVYLCNTKRLVASLCKDSSFVFKFPKKEETHRHKVWTVFCGRKDFTAGPSAVICHRHFTEDDLLNASFYNHKRRTDPSWVKFYTLTCMYLYNSAHRLQFEYYCCAHKNVHARVNVSFIFMKIFSHIRHGFLLLINSWKKLMFVFWLWLYYINWCIFYWLYGI